MLTHHLHRPFANFLRICLLRHRSILSRVGASEEDGAVQYEASIIGCLVPGEPGEGGAGRLRTDMVAQVGICG